MEGKRECLVSVEQFFRRVHCSHAFCGTENPTAARRQVNRALVWMAGGERASGKDGDAGKRGRGGAVGGA
ncbi:hypothetical protein DPX39_030039400 [Trypanosoma brucei equiperdum]|uniref:Uncharacterized protein n=1 Tax=Trypanosoma brucei equiperdum TaxID=630700 RepID=A0A3L6LB12_9TRYP|nr:hypothetical protein DPX39_030039400 [Trypanosoma brucei equiperdum]